ncbi:MAG TPA: pyridoxal-dependent decarboxylase, partial [Cytophagales bacterium]|nr:pyridoxal-dependent decarboxylase [Cytophagales bacterium]
MSIDIPTPEIPTAVGQHCYDGESQDQYQQSIGLAMEHLRTYMQEDRFYSGTPAADLQALRSRIQPNPHRTMSMEEALAELKEVYLDYAIRFHHPRYVAHLNCPVVLPALVGDLIASAANTAIETWDQSTSATLIEQEMIRWITQHLQLGFRADGVFTSGGTQSNLMALLMARDHYAYAHYGVNLKEGGWTEEVSRFRIFCSDKAHFSVKKNAALLGMGYQAVISVPSDSQMRMRPESLEHALERERAKGNIPIAVVATAGTTDYGSFDPLERISEIT